MTAEILSIGTELLLGDTVNTNAAFIGQELAALGISCYWQTVVGDNPSRLEAALTTALSRSDIVVATGGLGPTYDDLTKETVAKHFGREMELHSESFKTLESIYARTNRVMTDNNKKQAFMPVGAIVFHNDRGTANGLAVEDNGKAVIMLPGPPRENTAMFTDSVRPYLMKFTNNVLYSRNIHFFGIGESQLEQDLHDYMLSQTNPTIAPYAKEGEVLLRVTASAKTKPEADLLIQPVIDKITAKYSDIIYGVDIESLQNALVQKLKEKSMTIATAESCTGGLISKRITEIDGASAVFGFGACTYSNEAKVSLLGVNEETLSRHGAVSSQTAKEMAMGIRKIAGSSIGLSITGIAGPSGGTAEKSVGLVYIGVSTEGGHGRFINFPKT